MHVARDTSAPTAPLTVGDIVALVGDRSSLDAVTVAIRQTDDNGDQCETFATVACLMVWHGGRVEIVIDLDDH